MGVSRINSTALISLAAFSLMACQDKPYSNSQSSNSNTQNLDQMLAENNKGPQKELFTEGINALRDGNLDTAQIAFNRILQNDPRNSAGHTLNALTYHLKAAQGDIEALTIAEAGYNQARKFNETNTFAILQLGRIQVEKKNYIEAQDDFSTVILIDPANQEALYELANASYLIGDVKTSTMAVERLLNLNPKSADNLRAGALIFAAAGDHAKAQELVGAYNAIESNDKQRKFLAMRVADIQRLHDSGTIKVAQASDDTSTGDGGGDEAGTPPANGTGAGNGSTPNNGTASANGTTAPTTTPVTPTPTPAPTPAPAATAYAAPIPASTPIVQQIKPTHDDEMVVIDAIVMRVSDSTSSSYGHNILQDFSVTVSPYTKIKGRNLTGTNGVSLSSIPGITGAGIGSGMVQEGTGNSWVLGKGISFGAITYGLNIANTSGTHIEIIGRPTLTTTKGVDSFFFSGSDIKTVTNGQFGGNVASSKVGATLKVKVTDITPNGEVILDVDLNGTALTKPIEDAIADSAAGSGGAPNTIVYEVGESQVKTNVKVKFGETIMLGGIHDREDTTNDQGVPVLKDIPFVQYFFSERSTSNIRKNIMYLITPRSYKENLKNTRNYFERGRGIADEARPSLTELETRYKDWFNPNNNHILILREMAPIYPDFRIGDIRPIYWSHTEKIQDSLVAVADMLWF